MKGATALDPRTNAYDEQTRLAEEKLRGQLAGSWHYLTPQPFRAGKKRLCLRARPNELAPQVTEALPGEELALLWAEGGWARVRTAHDAYLGWLQQSEIDVDLKVNPAAPALQVTSLRAHAYAGPKVSQPVLAELCLGAWVQRAGGEVVEQDHHRWLPVLLPDGQEAWVQEVCFEALGGDRAALALRFLETPYVWGGRSAWGLDCSGLTQVVYAACGHAIPRDADQQRDALTPVDRAQAGDLAFFPGHVGLMLDERRMVHANATRMRVSVETLGEGDYGQRLQAALLGFGRKA